MKTYSFHYARTIIRFPVNKGSLRTHVALGNRRDKGGDPFFARRVKDCNKGY
jgi:hypothetical protein